MIYAYYHQNILFGYTNPEKFQTIVEIGAGNGNFAGLLKNSLNIKPHLEQTCLPKTLLIIVSLSTLKERTQLIFCLCFLE